MTLLQIKLLAGAAALAVFLAGSGFLAKTIYDKGYRAAEAECQARADTQRAAMQKAFDETSRELEIARAKADKVRVERTATIREIYRDSPTASADCAPHPDALRVLDDALSDAAP